MRSAFRPPERLARLSLRTRLLLLLVALAVVGLAAADFASYRALHDYLYGRVDQQLESAVLPVSGSLARKAGLGELGDSFGPGPEAGVGTAGAEGGGGPGPGGPDGHVPTSAFGQLRDSGGEVVARTPVRIFGEVQPVPAIPTDLEATSIARISPVTVGERGGGSEKFRAAAVDLKGGGEAIVAVPLGDTDATLSHLVVIEIVVSAVILAALAAAAWWLVGIGLRPLRRMGEVAGQIAAGDLSRRVEPDDERTEVGRLGRSLNAMLGQIESAFAAQAAGERRLRRFLADASHELRTPLASIRGYSELYRIGAAREPAEVERAMDRIEAESARMGGLVDDLLTLARVDEVREPAREPLDLRELMEDARDDARAAAPEREIRLSGSVGGDPGGGTARRRRAQSASAIPLVPIEADGDALRRVLANLLRNAVVHTPEGTPIELGLAASGADSTLAAGTSVGTAPGTATITVRDHGPGLPPGDPNAVFERFWRDSESRGRDDGGAGLGLAIVAAIVTAHGGTVKASNPPGGGALFTVRLPLH